MTQVEKLEQRIVRLERKIRDLENRLDKFTTECRLDGIDVKLDEAYPSGLFPDDLIRYT